MNITGMSEQWIVARVKQKGECKCIPWRNLRDLILVHPDMKKRVDVFSLSIYGLMIFPRELGYVDKVVSNLFDRLDKGVTPVPAILAETFRSLSVCRRASEGRFIRPRQEGSRPMEEYLQIVPSELEIIKHDFEKRNSELGKKIEQLEEEKMHLRLEADVQKLEAEKLRKAKRNIEKDSDSLKIDYKKLRMLMRTIRLGKTSEQW
ncbi:hypothetical protein PVK06_030433 [Gossypium arboreum]|uniref:DUF7745 domain-containing protein n=1 Tax=Gossypium arboreum TaxID=29729 RepID=A0ABR0NN96_GOSAR|nr:hypothetical protein PVK06_030433 [Gossypium arboreum]